MKHGAEPGSAVRNNNFYTPAPLLLASIFIRDLKWSVQKRANILQEEVGR